MQIKMTDLLGANEYKITHIFYLTHNFYFSSITALKRRELSMITI